MNELERGRLFAIKKESEQTRKKYCRARDERILRNRNDVLRRDGRHEKSRSVYRAERRSAPYRYGTEKDAGLFFFVLRFIVFA